jgi:hypothetical protein
MNKATTGSGGSCRHGIAERARRTIPAALNIIPTDILFARATQIYYKYRRRTWDEGGDEENPRTWRKTHDLRKEEGISDRD